MIDPLLGDAGNSFERIRIGSGFDFDDDEFGVGCFGDVVEGLLFGRVADGGYDCGVCTTEVLFQ